MIVNKLISKWLHCALAGMLAGGVALASVVAQNTRGVRPPNPARVGAPLNAEDADIGIFSSDMVLPWMPLFADQPYENETLFSKKAPMPPCLEGALFYLLDSQTPHTFVCEKAGDILGVAFAADTAACAALERGGFKALARAKLAYPFQKTHGTDIVVYKKALETGERVAMPAGTLLAGFEPPARPAHGGQTLYNGIALPAPWPPIVDANDAASATPPYLKSRPAVVPIDIGRQLLIDDFLVEQTDLAREFHHPEKYAGNPVLKPETALEKTSRFGNCAVAAPLGGGVWWNPEKQCFELWYEAGHVSNLAFATSKDGLTWERPACDVFPPTNKILAQAPDSWSVIRDYQSANPAERYKMIMRGPDMDIRRSVAYTSGDGVHWQKRALGGFSGDRVTAFYNPFRQKWVFSLRWGVPSAGRCRAYWESDDFIKGTKWQPQDPVFWARTDKADPQILPKKKGGTQLYNLDACAYESLMLGFFQIHYGPDNNTCAARGLPKITGLNFAYSRDGFHWHRPDRTLALASTQTYGDWDCGYVQSVGNIGIVRGDKFYIYYTAFAGDPNQKWDARAKDKLLAMFASGMHQNGAMGVAVLRRDGFASLNAAAGKTGTLLTRPVLFSGSRLFVNVDAPDGRLLAQVVGMDGKPIAPFTFENCEGVRGDTTLAQMKWKGGSDLSALANRPVRFEFKLENGKLYAFWVSRDESGRSDGYVAGGGPGFTSNVDTVGKTAYEADAKLEAALKKETAKPKTPASAARRNR